MKHIEVGESRTGRGVFFAGKKAKPGDEIGIIEGRVVEAGECDPDYSIDLPSGRVLDPSPPFRFLNHSCEPNAELFWWDEAPKGGDPPIRIAALRPIRRGEEVTIGYGWATEVGIPCHCGSASCTGWIGVDYGPLSDEGERLAPQNGEAFHREFTAESALLEAAAPMEADEFPEEPKKKKKDKKRKKGA